MDTDPDTVYVTGDDPFLPEYDVDMKRFETAESLI